MPGSETNPAAARTISTISPKNRNAGAHNGTISYGFFVEGKMPVDTENESQTIRAAIEEGQRDENRLADLIFNARHPERDGQRLQPGEQQLIDEWADIRDHLVRPALAAASVGPSTTTSVPASTTSGVEADGDTTNIIQCISGLEDKGRSISFVQRYLRNLTPAEVTALRNAGFTIVSCFEEGQGAVLEDVAHYTRAQGQHDGRRAFTQAQAVGQTADTPIYFAVDADPSPGQRQAILEYFRGVAEGYQQYLSDMDTLGQTAVAYAVGVYGSGCVLGWCQAEGLATWFWQAFAPGWCDNKKIWPGANIHTSGPDKPARCGWRLGHLEGWGNEGGW